MSDGGKNKQNKNISFQLHSILEAYNLHQSAGTRSLWSLLFLVQVQVDSSGLAVVVDNRLWA